MYDLRYIGKFKRDLKTCQKRGYNLQLLKTIVDTLRIPEPLEIKNRDHDLKGNYKGFRECHIAPDWLLVYEVVERDLILYLMRTGTHSDLF